MEQAVYGGWGGEVGRKVATAHGMGLQDGESAAAWGSASPQKSECRVSSGQVLAWLSRMFVDVRIARGWSPSLTARPSFSHVGTSAIPHLPISGTLWVSVARSTASVLSTASVPCIHKPLFLNLEHASLRTIDRAPSHARPPMGFSEFRSGWACECRMPSIAQRTSIDVSRV
jgi:hypothetical protein